MPKPYSARWPKAQGRVCGGYPMARPASARPRSVFCNRCSPTNPAIEVATDVQAFKFTQWDGKLLREIPRLRVKPGAKPDSETFETGYAEMAIASWSLFEQLQTAGVIPATLKFQISLPTPIAPTYNNMVPADRPLLLPALTRHFRNPEIGLRGLTTARVAIGSAPETSP
jgi:hypothetical protein